MANTERLAAQGFLSSRNTEDQANWYGELAEFFKADDSDPLLKARSFALYAPRQTISDFLVRHELFKLIADVPGAILEFGVFNGQGLLSWAHFSSIHEPYHICREIVGFDTFAGFAGVGTKDASDHPEVVKEGGYNVDSFARINKAIELFDRNRPIGHVKKVSLVAGDVTKTLRPFLADNPHIAPALVYLDMDIYEPTKFALQELLPRMAKGSVVAFDEFAHRTYPGETSALRDVVAMKDVQLRRVPFCSRIAYFVV
jgi:hypothetical protein